MFANYKYDRNEPVLLYTLGFQKLQSRHVEKEFLHVLINSEFLQINSLPQNSIVSSMLTNEVLPTLVIVMGGFMDTALGFAYDICAVLRKMAKETNPFHLFYREHDEASDVRFLVNHYAKCGSRIILIGHSWGGSSLIMHVARKLTAPIDLIITIDPIGIFRPQNVFKHVHYWLNIYVNYKKASYNVYNNAGRVGRAWENCPLANRNISSIILEHQNAVDMFMLYCIEDFWRVL